MRHPFVVGNFVGRINTIWGTLFDMFPVRLLKLERWTASNQKDSSIEGEGETIFSITIAVIPMARIIVTLEPIATFVFFHAVSFNASFTKLTLNRSLPFNYLGLTTGGCQLRCQ